MVQRLQRVLEKIIAQERSAKKLAVTFCLGIYIGISPFAGFHTIMTFLFAWLFALNIAALFAVSFLIHNPWTTLPIYTIDHFFGKLMFRFLGVDCMQFDPEWVESCNHFLMHHTGISGLSLTAFLVGGNVLAIGISVLLYPFLKRVFETYLAKKMVVISNT